MGNIERRFIIGDWVVYKPYENCCDVNISGKGKVVGVLDDATYIVTFGYDSIHGTRTSEYNWSNLWLLSDSNGI